MAQTPLPLPEECKTLQIIEYDTIKYDFLGLVSEIVGLEDLGGAHRSKEMADSMLMAKKFSRPPKSSRNSLNKRWRVATSAGGSHYDRVRGLLSSFCAEVCARSLGCDAVVYQDAPTFRVHLAGTGKDLGKRHTDAEYCHQPGEVNFWLPLTEVFGTNTLWTESAPGRKDFAPLVARPGQVVRFYGNQCEHYTMPNEEDVTRVSLDFRVVPAACFVPRYIAPKLLERTTRGKNKRMEPFQMKAPFELGCWYNWTYESGGKRDALEAGEVQMASEALGETPTSNATGSSSNNTFACTRQHYAWMMERRERQKRTKEERAKLKAQKRKHLELKMERKKRNERRMEAKKSKDSRVVKE
jgi:hypothetical protein